MKPLLVRASTVRRGDEMHPSEPFIIPDLGSRVVYPVTSINDNGTTTRIEFHDPGFSTSITVPSDSLVGVWRYPK